MFFARARNRAVLALGEVLASGPSLRILDAVARFSFPLRMLSLGLIVLAACATDRLGGVPWSVDGGPQTDGGPPGTDGGPPPEEDGGTVERDAGPVTCEVPGACNPFIDEREVNCSRGESCRPNDAKTEMECRELEDDPLGEGELCTTGASCAAGLLCSGPDPLNFRCRTLCPTGSSGWCPEGQWCADSTGVTCVDLCAPRYPECDIYTPDCGGGEACSPILNPETNGPLTACVPAGAGADGDACGDGIGGGCGPGLLCVRVDGAELCRHVCREAGNPGCPEGQSCVGTVPTWNITHCLPD